MSEELQSFLLPIVVFCVLVGGWVVDYKLIVRHERAKLKPMIAQEIEKAYWEGHDDGEKAGLLEARAMREKGE